MCAPYSIADLYMFRQRYWRRRPSSSWHREASLDSLAPPIVPRQRERIKLAQVKSNLYNPILPTLRRYDMDDVICKLADEHHRHTSYLTKSELKTFYCTYHISFNIYIYNNH